MELDPQNPCKKLDVVAWVYNPSHSEMGRRFLEAYWVANIDYLAKICAYIDGMKHKVVRHLDVTLVFLSPMHLHT